MKQPNKYPRRILVAGTGMSPQIVTETVFALAVAAPALRFIPTEIHLITTGVGAKKARAALLAEGQNWLTRLRNDYALPAIHFDENSIHIISHSGAPLDDIRSVDDNRMAANFITSRIREWTADFNCSLHVSIAGGRKTMGFFLGYALSLYGREQDRLSHVLVSDPFESSPDFFYPTPYDNELTLRDGSPANTAKAVVTLAEIPFVSLRHGLPSSLLTEDASYGETVEIARAAIGPASLTIDLAQRQIHAAGKMFSLPPTELALLSVFARRATNGLPPLLAPNKEVFDPAWAQRYLAELKLIAGSVGDLDKTEKVLRDGMDGSYFSIHLSRLKKELRQQLGLAAEPYLVSDGGGRPRRYCLTLKPNAIKYVTIGGN